MGKYILRRILYAIPIAFGVSVVCFSLVYIAPGDPLQTVLPPDATAERAARSKRSTVRSSR
jgi:peptide/nickel transport system permease protein